MMLKLKINNYNNSNNNSYNKFNNKKKIKTIKFYKINKNNKNKINNKNLFKKIQISKIILKFMKKLITLHISINQFMIKFPDSHQIEICK